MAVFFSAVNSAGLKKSLVVRGNGGRLFHALAYNSSADIKYLQIFDAITLPANGAVPLMVAPIPAANIGYIDYALGRPFQNGIVLALSTTAATLTITTTDDAFIDAVTG